LTEQHTKIAACHIKKELQFSGKKRSIANAMKRTQITEVVE